MTSTPPEPNARALLRTAADTLRYYAEHGGYLTDENGETHSLWADERTALALARQITQHTTATSYYLTMQCQHCQSDMHTLAVTTTHADGVPVIPWDSATSATFTCDDCGTVHDTAADFDSVVIVDE